ncbi:FtsX-like permease family protein, partial [Inconstantimicrobium porci]
MFYSLVKRNSKRNRKENGLFFVSLIISIVAFYIILSLKEQDVIIFLKTMESDALHKLFMLIPALYIMSLFILFFLVYFAGKYQLDRRSRELGMYMMLGMKRSKLLLMLFAEELYNSVLSLVIGMPVAVFISEIISLVTAKVVGLGIISHHFSLSVSAVIWTIIGYFLIRFAALIILCVQFTSKEVTELLNESQTEKKRESNKTITIIELILGITLIVTAFYLAISGKSWVRLASMSLSLLIGIAGLFLFFHGISILFEM